MPFHSAAPQGHPGSSQTQGKQSVSRKGNQINMNPSNFFFFLFLSFGQNLSTGMPVAPSTSAGWGELCSCQALAFVKAEDSSAFPQQEPALASLVRLVPGEALKGSSASGAKSPLAEGPCVLHAQTQVLLSESTSLSHEQTETAQGHALAYRSYISSAVVNNCLF